MFEETLFYWEFYLTFQAVCCSDGEHCCPHNTTCDVSEGKCLKGDKVMDWYEKVAAVRVGSVICPDGAHECPNGQTCCKLASGDWGCCPLPKVGSELSLLLPFFCYQLIVMTIYSLFHLPYLYSVF